MRILHAIPSINPASGGPIEGVTQLAGFARRSGHSVEIASLDSPDDPWVKAFANVVYPLGPGIGSFRFSPRFEPWLRAHAAQYDIVVVNGIWQYHSFAVRRALRASRTPYVVFTHGMLDPWFRKTYPWKHVKKWFYWPWGDYRVLADAAAVLFTCAEECTLARRSFWLYRANEVVVNYGTASPPDDSASQGNYLAECFPHLVGKRIALHLGRLHPKKGCDIVIKTFASELASNPAWHLVMAGPDQVGWKAELEALAAKEGISERITWTGVVNGNLKWGLMRAAEVMLLPSHQENFGIVIAEALACRLPVLISNKVNIWQEVQSDGAGFVGLDTVEGLSRMVNEWLHLSTSEKVLMRDRAHICFEDKFEISRAGNQFLQVLSGIVAAGRKMGPFIPRPELA